MANLIDLQERALLAQEAAARVAEYALITSQHQAMISTVAVLAAIAGLGISAGALYQTQRAMADQRRASRQHIRAYLYASRAPVVDFANSKSPTVKVQVKNVGVTEALNVQLSIDAALVDYDKPFATPRPAFMPDRRLVPDQHVIMSYTLETLSLSRTQLSKIIETKACLAVWGEVRFKDVFGRSHDFAFGHLRYGAGCDELEYFDPIFDGFSTSTSEAAAQRLPGDQKPVDDHPGPPSSGSPEGI